MQLFPSTFRRQALSAAYSALATLSIVGLVLSPLQPALEVAAASLPAAPQNQLRAPLFAPTLAATKADALFTDVDGDTLADPGDVLRYTVTMTNTGSEATGVTFNDTLDANTTLVANSVNVAPIAVTDVYTTVGNTLLVISNTAPAGPVVFLSGTAFSNDLEFLGDTFSLSTYSATSAQGGAVTMDAAGRFSYLPPVGFTGTDTFTYTVADGTGATDGSTVTINVVGRVWYVRNNAGAGDGRSSTPFNTLAAAQTASAANDTIYVMTGDGGTTGQNAGFALKTGQRLLGQGVALTMPVSVDGVSPSVTLQAAGTAPQIGNAAGNGVSAVEVLNVEVQGLNIGGTAHAVVITTTTAITGTAEIANNTIRAAGQNGVDVNKGGAGTLTFSLHDNIVTATGNGIDVQRTAGSLNITAFDDNVVTGNTGGTGINLVGTGAAILFDANPATASFETVAGGTTAIGQSGNGVGAAGLIIDNARGDINFIDLDIFANGGRALFADGTTANYTGSAGLRMTVGAGVAMLFATGGAAAELREMNVNLPINLLTSNNSLTNGLLLFDVSGSFSAGAGSSITNAANAAVSINGNSAAAANVSTVYAGTIMDDVGLLVQIQNVTASSTHTFSGAITDGNNGDGNGVSLTGNPGATITFSGGLILATGNQPAFTATGGGTVNVCDENPCNPGATGALVNSLTTTTGTALNVANTTIGANNLEFRSISANGATNGVVLNATGSSGGLVIKGNSSGLCGGQVGSGPPTSAATVTAPNTADCTGGTIQNTTGAGIVLTNTSNVSITRLWLRNSGDDGVQATNVTGFTLMASFLDSNGNALNENGLDFGVSGSTTPDGLHGLGGITNSTIQNSYYNGVFIANSGGTALIAFTITGSQFRANAANGDANDNILFQANGTANMAISISGSYFASTEGDHFQAAGANSGTLNVTITNNTFTGGHSTPLGQGITINAATGVAFGGGYSGRVDYDVNGNHINGAVTNAIHAILGTSSNAAVFDGFIRNNVIGTSGVGLSCSAQGNGIGVEARGNGTHNASVTGNIIRRCYDRGILSEAGDGSGVLNLTVQSNIIDQQIDSNPPTHTAREAIQTNYGITSNNVFGVADAPTICLQLGGAGGLANTFSHGSGAPDDFRLRKRFSATVRLPGYGGGTSNSAGDLAQVVAFIQGQNTGSVGEPGSAAASGVGGGYTGGASCMQPSANIGNGLVAHKAPQTAAQAAHTKFVPTVAAETVMVETLTPAANFSGGKALFRLAEPKPLLSGENININLGTLPAGEKYVITFRATVDNPFPAGPTTVCNQGTFSGSNFSNVLTNDPDTPAANDTTCTLIDVKADLRLTKSDGVASAVPGETVVYTLNYTNAATSTLAATNSIITETLPANTTYAGSGWTLVSGSTYTRSVGTVNIGASGSVTFAVTVNNPAVAGLTVITNTASIGFPGPEVNPADNNATDTTSIVAAPEMQLNKSDGGVTVTPGGLITYTLTYTNAGNQNATGVALTETVPANTTFVGTGWTCAPSNAAGSVCTRNIGAVNGSGAGGSVPFVVQVVSLIPAGVEAISNTASVADDGTNGVDATPANNTATDTTPVNAAPDYAVSKTDGVTSVLEGQTLTYTISYSNTGNQNGTGVFLTELVPAGATFNAGASTAGWALVSGSTYTYNVGALAGGAGGSVNFGVTVDDPATTFTISNTVSIADDGANGADATPTNNSATDVDIISVPPVLGAIGNKSVDELATLVFTATATDGNAPPQTLTFSLDAGAPSGASMGSSSGVFSWTPTEAQGPGTYTVTVRVTDNGSPALADFETFNITVSEVNGAPVLGAIGNQSVTELATLTFTATVTDGDVPANTQTFSLDAGAPSGANIGSSSGVFNWTPTEAQGPGVYTVTVRVTDNGSPALDDFETFAITVNEANTAPVLGAIGNKVVDELATLVFTATVTDTDEPAQTLTFSLDAGAPSGANISSSSGVFNWTPTEAQGPGVYTVTVRVTDGTADDFETFSITVNDVNNAPVLGAIGNKVVDELATLVFTATVTDTDEPAQTLTFSLDAGAPSGASIGSSSGVFNWTPNENQGPGVYTATVRVTDGAADDLETIVITVNEVNAAPTLGVIGPKSVNELVTLTFTATVADTDNPVQTLTFSLDAGAPSGASIGSSNGVFSWTPSETQGPGVYTITVRVTDNGSPTQNDFEDVVITVNEANQAPVADDDTFQVEVDSANNTLDVLTGDSDADLPAQTLTIVAVGSTSNGGTVFNNGTTLSYTPTASFQGTETFTYTVSDGNGGTDTALVTVDVSSIRYIYLPWVAKNYANGPDLVVQSVTSNGNNVQVVLANQGTVCVSSPAEEFWVDVYINPTTPPTAVNQVWRTVGTQGLVWGVTASAFPLCPSQTLTLTVGDAYYFASDSVVSFPLPNGTPLYAQVDSYNPSTSYGVVRENHEIMGLAYNNITSGIVGAGPTTADMPLPPTVFVQREPDVNLPKRPQ